MCPEKELPDNEKIEVNRWVSGQKRKTLLTTIDGANGTLNSFEYVNGEPLEILQFKSDNGSIRTVLYCSYNHVRELEKLGIGNFSESQKTKVIFMGEPVEAEGLPGLA